MHSSRVLLRTLVATLLLVGLVPLLASPAASTLGEKEIRAKSLTGYACDSTEWHFVITQINANEEDPPPSITVTWANGATADVKIGDSRSAVAHYTTKEHLDSTVTSATAEIYDSWSGQFNLSHGPCKKAPEKVAAVAPTVTQAECTADYVLIPASYTVHETKGVDYYVDDKLVTNLNVPIPANEYDTVTVTAKARQGYELAGETTFEFEFDMEPFCDDPNGKLAGTRRPTETQAECTDTYEIVPPSYVVHATEGVDYYIDHKLVTNLDVAIPARAGTTIDVVARAQKGYTLAGATKFTLWFDADPECVPPKLVGGEYPVITQAQCAADYTLTKPSFTIVPVEGVEYFLHGKKVTGTIPAEAGTVVQVTAAAEDGYLLVGQYTFSLTFTANPPCEKPKTTVTAVSPTFADSVCVAATAASSSTASYTIPATTGVDYLVDGVKVAAGTVAVADGSTVTVTAQAQPGHVLAAPLSVSHTFPVPACVAAANAAATSTPTPTPTAIPTATATPTAAAAPVAVAPVKVGAPAAPAVPAAPQQPAAPAEQDEDTEVAGVQVGSDEGVQSVAGGALADTGARLPLLPTVAGAVLLLLVGGALLTVSRRRRNAYPTR